MEQNTKSEGIEAAAFLSPDRRVLLLKFINILLRAENLDIPTENLSLEEILNLFDLVSEQNLITALDVLEQEKAKHAVITSEQSNQAGLSKVKKVFNKAGANDK